MIELIKFGRYTLCNVHARVCTIASVLTTTSSLQTGLLHEIYVLQL